MNNEISNNNAASIVAIRNVNETQVSEMTINNVKCKNAFIERMKDARRDYESYKQDVGGPDMYFKGVYAEKLVKECGLLFYEAFSVAGVFLDYKKVKVISDLFDAQKNGTIGVRYDSKALGYIPWHADQESVQYPQFNSRLAGRARFTVFPTEEAAWEQHVPAWEDISDIWAVTCPIGRMLSL